jgi:hydroxymethylpyrimidine pyrophosphatase-like HAD family hydrolase
LRAALDELGLSAQDVVGVGDAENDEAFLAMCGFGVAVANALDSLKARADRVTIAENGAGVREIIESMINGSA